MTTFTSKELARLETIDIDLARVLVPAFGGEKGYWSDYDRISEDGIDAIPVFPRLYGQPIGSFAYLRLDATPEDPHFQDSYGLVYGDPAFEENMARHVLDIFGLHPEPGGPNLLYTEQGQQIDNVISMECTDPVIDRLVGISNHALLALARDPRILRLAIDGRLIPTGKTDR